MALNKQQVNINFSRGLDTKTDPWQVPLGNFLELENSVFNKQGLLQKRNGFLEIGNPNDSSVSQIATYNDDIVAIGSNLYAYNDPTNSFVNKGEFHPCELTTQVANSNFYNKTEVDSVRAPNGLLLTTYIENQALKYTIQNSETGQVVVNPTNITVTGPAIIASSAKAYLYNNYFILLFIANNGGVFSIRYVAIDWDNLTVSGPAIFTNILALPLAGNSLPFEAIVVGNLLFIAFNATGGAGVYCGAITPSLGIYAAVQIDAGSQLTSIGACTDGVNAYFPYYSSVTGIGRISAATSITGAIVAVAGFTQQWITTQFIGTLTNLSDLITNIPSTAHIFNGTQIQNISGGAFPPASVVPAYSYVIQRVSNTSLRSGSTYLVNRVGATITLGSVKNITASCVNGTINIICDIAATYDYQSAPQTETNSIYYRTCSTAGVMGTAPTTAIRRGVSLWSKAVVLNDKTFFVASYSKGTISSTYTKRTEQPCYFLLDLDGNIYARLAYRNGFGYNDVKCVNVSNVSFSGSCVANTTTISSIADTSHLQVGQRIISTNFPLANTYIESIVSSSEITVTKPAIATVSTLCQSNDIYFPFLKQNTLQTQNVSLPNAESLELILSQNNAAYNSRASLYSTKTNAVQLSSNLAMSGGVLWNYDGLEISENNFLIAPDSIGLSNAGAGAMIPQDYYYRVVYQWTDNQGNLNQSATNIPISITIPAGPNASVYIYVPTLRMTEKNNVVIAVFRWSTAQQTYYRITSVVAAPSNVGERDYLIFYDNSTDSQIVGNEILYSNGTVLENQSPNPSSALAIFDNRLWLADTEIENQVFYSKQVIPGTPIEMSDLLTLYVSPIQSSQGTSGPVTGLFPMDDKLIIFKENAIYYLNGTGPDNSGENSQYSEPILITATVGCTNQKSIVFMQNGLMFQSDKGIWLLERNLQTFYIGAPVESFTENATVLSANLIPGTNQVRMPLSSGIMLMYDYFYQQWGTFTNIPSQSAIVSLGKHTLLDIYGRILQETENNYLDAGNPVLMKFRTAWIALAGILGFQRAYFLFLLGKYVSPHKLIAKIGYDFDPFEYQTIVITPNNYNAPWGNDPVYGSTSLWGGNSQVEKWRLMFEKQKCDSIQITIEEQYDPSIGEPAGEGLTLSGINCVVGIKRVFGTYPASITAG